MSPTDVLAIAGQLTHAIATGDVEALARLYVPRAVIWHSTDQVEMKLQDMLGLVGAIKAVADCTVDVTNTLPTGLGFVQTQRNTYTFRDGRSTFFHAALVVSLDSEGCITRLEEYLDSAGLAPLVAALS